MSAKAKQGSGDGQTKPKSGSLFRKPRNKGNRSRGRKRQPVKVDPNAAGDVPTPEDMRELLRQTKQLQRDRKRSRGLLIDPTMQTQDLADAGTVTESDSMLDSTFKEETKEEFLDQALEKYIDREMARKRGDWDAIRAEEEEDLTPAERILREEERSLYETPHDLRGTIQPPESTDDHDQEAVKWLGDVLEVDLGEEARLRNEEATLRATARLLAQQKAREYEEGGDAVGPEQDAPAPGARRPRGARNVPHNFNAVLFNRRGHDDDRKQPSGFATDRLAISRFKKSGKAQRVFGTH